jgi:hypothetical protein
MLVEIHSLDNGSGVNTKLDVYLSYNPQRKLFEQRPFCMIEEDDFFDLLAEKEFEKAQNGKIHFNVAKTQLFEKANKVY